MPFVGAIVLIFTYSLLLAIIPPSLTATTKTVILEEAAAETALPAEQVVSADAITPPEENALVSVQ